MMPIRKNHEFNHRIKFKQCRTKILESSMIVEISKEVLGSSSMNSIIHSCRVQNQGSIQKGLIADSRMRSTWTCIQESGWISGKWDKVVKRICLKWMNSWYTDMWIIERLQNEKNSTEQSVVARGYRAFVTDELGYNLIVGGRRHFRLVVAEKGINGVAELIIFYWL